MTHGVHSSLRLPADLAVLGFVRSALACLLTREEWPPEAACIVLLASNEVLTNAIEHGSPVGAAVEVELSVTEGWADLRVVDQGVPGRAVPTVPAEPPPPSSERGRGLLIISRLADELTVRPQGRGTEVTVGFRRPEARPATASERTARRAA
ncbi:ATP-binding protein [Miltoncostaea marina]|uniref:ATP-binding protein n=1 Tax=Miltoncostaea marina TaxID=2843215 RepID=UPI001C3C7083|nr:ATP-binding protein [Miltoncostaea marina]